MPYKSNPSRVPYGGENRLPSAVALVLSLTIGRFPSKYRSPEPRSSSEFRLAQTQTNRWQSKQEVIRLSRRKRENGEANAKAAQSSRQEEGTTATGKVQKCYSLPSKEKHAVLQSCISIFNRLRKSEVKKM